MGTPPCRKLEYLEYYATANSETGVLWHSRVGYHSHSSRFVRDAAFHWIRRCSLYSQKWPLSPDQNRRGDGETDKLRSNRQTLSPSPFARVPAGYWQKDENPLCPGVRAARLLCDCPAPLGRAGVSACQPRCFRHPETKVQPMPWRSGANGRPGFAHAGFYLEGRSERARHCSGRCRGQPVVPADRRAGKACDANGPSAAVGVTGNCCGEILDRA